jgi:hypothetical protein
VKLIVAIELEQSTAKPNPSLSPPQKKKKKKKNQKTKKQKKKKKKTFGPLDLVANKI